MDRRGFLKGMAGILAAGVAPAAIGSGVLMPVKKLWTPPFHVWEAVPFGNHEARILSWTVSNDGPAPLTFKGVVYGERLILQPGDCIEVYRARS